jgi:hypothetical protein
MEVGYAASEKGLRSSIAWMVERKYIGGSVQAVLSRCRFRGTQKYIGDVSAVAEEVSRR